MSARKCENVLNMPVFLFYKYKRCFYQINSYKNILTWDDRLNAYLN